MLLKLENTHFNYILYLAMKFCTFRYGTTQSSFRGSGGNKLSEMKNLFTF